MAAPRRMRPSDLDKLDRLLSSLNPEAQALINDEYAPCGLKYDILRQISEMIRASKDNTNPVTPRSHVIAGCLKGVVLAAKSRGTGCGQLIEDTATHEFGKWVITQLILHPEKVENW